MTGKDTVVFPERCQNCKSAKRKEKVWWICRKNCVERNNIDTCMMLPIQFEPIEQPLPEQENIALQHTPSPCAYLLIEGMNVRCLDSFYPSRVKCNHLVNWHCWDLSNQREMAIRQDEREKANKIFDHTLALCDAIIEKLDCQSKLGFNAMLIKRDIESLRAGKDGEGND